MRPAMGLLNCRTMLIVDAVEWSPAYPQAHPLRNVGEWFARFLRGDPDIEVSIVSAADDVLATAKRPSIAGVLISGSPRDAWAPDPVNDRLAQVILHCHQNKVPFLGVCYGHQLMGMALGAKVGRDPAGVEFGNTPIELTEAGRRDPLFDGIPNAFDALESHQDSVQSLPEGATLLATGRHTPIQAFRYGDWLRGVQFHPEHDPDILRFIWEPRRVTWRDRCDFDIDARMQALQPTPAGPQLLKNFLNLCRSTAS